MVCENEGSIYYEDNLTSVVVVAVVVVAASVVPGSVVAAVVVATVVAGFNDTETKMSYDRSFV